jgi:FtsP/CotA-like multicopper oxidase with cupredoxin domain
MDQLRRVFLIGGCALGCSSSGAPDSVAGHSDVARFREPPVLVDTNPDPNVVEVSLVASVATTEYLAGKRTEIWGYRDGSVQGSVASVPGPMLRAKKGDEIIVHFKNELPESTTIHWHGVRLAANMDGSTSVQRPVDPGASFDYRFRVQDAGSFWYHPHVRADRQIERGLYAPLVVTGDETAIETTAERYLVLDDIKLTADGALAEGDAMEIMTGRQGNVFLVNGARAAELHVPSGGRERWRLVNAANARFFNLRLPGHRFVIIAVDGGLLPAPRIVDTLLVAPGERYDVVVDFAAGDGTRATLESIHYDRGHELPDEGPKPLVQLVYDGRVEKALAPVPSRLRSIEALPITAQTFRRKFVLREEEAPDGTRFLINDEYWPFNKAVMVKQGDVEIWEVEGTKEMDHPFHLHGMFFQPLLPDGTVDVSAGWKDTINIVRGTTLRFAVRYDAPLGMWMFHCHILEHAERGMMGELMVMQ